MDTLLASDLFRLHVMLHCWYILCIDLCNKSWWWWRWWWATFLLHPVYIQKCI